MAHADRRRSIEGFSTGSCYGSVLLDDELWQSLTALNGHDVPWVHGCVLEHGHDGDHGAPAYHEDGKPQQWLRWRHTGPARLERVDPSLPGRHSGPVSSVPDPDHPSDVESSPVDSQVEALRAIAAAIDRLADAVIDLRKPPRDNGNV